MTDVLAFDMRVYDPEAPIIAEITSPTATNFPGSAIEPGDAGWGSRLTGGGAAGPTPTIIGRGAYVDLGYLSLHNAIINRNTAITPKITASANVLEDLVNSSVFSISPAVRSQLNIAGGGLEAYRVYDTWSSHYENNGIDEDDRDGDTDQFTGFDEGTNGFDDNGMLGPDDPAEFETAPPYNAPLRGVQITIRRYEPDSRQIREVKVKHTFVPQ